MAGNAEEPDKPLGGSNSPYSDMSDEAFLAELRFHLHDRSWTLAHLVELEDRGYGLTSGDVELHEAIQEELESLNDQFRSAMEPLLESVRLKVSPMLEQLSKGLNAFRPFEEVIRSSEKLLSVVPRRPTADIVSSASDLQHRGLLPALDIPSDSVIHDMAKREAEVYEAQLKTAVAAGAMVEKIDDLTTAVEGRDWYDWALLTLGAIAAAAAVTGVVLCRGGVTVCISTHASRSSGR